MLTISIVLFCLGDKLWKLADFGISAKAVTAALTTQDAKGTSGYRAPELLREKATYTVEVDIWALGCIMYNLVTGKAMFRNDYAVIGYSEVSQEALELVTPGSEFWSHHIRETICLLLQKDPRNRPRASKLCELFYSYCQLLQLSIAQKLADIASYPSYKEWIQLVNDSSKEEFLYRLANWYETRELDAAIAMRDELVHNEAMTRYKHSKTTASPVSFDDYLAEVRMERGEYIAAAQIYIEAIKKKPEAFWGWNHFGRVHVAWNGIENAIGVFREKMTTFPANSSSVMALINLYAAKEDYGAAIGTYMEHLPGREEWDILLSNSEDPLVPTDSNEGGSPNLASL
jgi:tetratricopeptide (TPR) repeat protein